MRTVKTLTAAAAAITFGLAASAVQAKVSADEAAKLGDSLTPIGAEKAGNGGDIPEWTPFEPHGDKIVTDPKWGEDRYASEKPVATITKANMAEYADKLSEGHKALLDRYDTYKIPLYPSHRDAAWPAAIYEATKANATTAELVGGDPDALKGAKLGFPFPIPQSGAEPIWNHRLKWRGEAVVRYNNQAIVQGDGTTLITKLIEEVMFPYASIANPGPFEGEDDVSIYYLSETVAPPRNAGQFILGWEHPGKRSAWIYNPALRRIRRAPSVAYDNPYEGTDGNQFYDQVDMINGKLDRFTWKLVGKKDMIIPYNSDKINSNSLKYKDITTARHINQDLTRYEVHRVWVVEAENKPDLRHTFKKKVLYIDEDTWSTAMVDNYDQRDQFYKFQEGHLVYSPEMKSSSSIPEIIYDLQSGTYFATAMINEDKPNDFTVEFDKKHFDPNQVKKRTTR